MRQLLLIFCTALLITSDVIASEPRLHAVTETNILPDGELALKQRCELVVRFLSDGFAFSGAPSFPDVQIEGAIVIPPRSGMNITERRNGQTWIGVQRLYSVYPTRTGKLVIPSFSIGASVRNSTGVTDVTAESESLVRQVVIPSALSDHPGAIVTSKLDISQQFEPDVNELKVGEAIRRTVSVTAENTVAMLLPNLIQAEIDDLKAYPDQPVLNDREYRGSITATRTDSVAYIVQKEGWYELSPISVFWWDPTQDQIREAKVPAYGLTVIADPLWAKEPNDPNELMQTETEVTIFGGSAKYFIAAAAIIIFLLLSCGWLFRRHGHTIHEIITDFRIRRAESEKAYFRSFQQACLANDPQATFRTLLAWLDRQSEFHGTSTLEDFAGRFGDNELRTLIRDLYARLFGKDAIVSQSWSGEGLARAVAQARRKSQKQHSKTQKDVGLCPLNPSA